MEGNKSFTRRYEALFKSRITKIKEGGNSDRKLNEGGCNETGCQQKESLAFEQELEQKLGKKCAGDEKAVHIVTEDDRLRGYQQEAVRKILSAWGAENRNVMLQMPTGTGKTRLFVALISALTESGAENFGLKGEPRFLIVTHREELVEQISDTLISHYHLEHIILGVNNIVTQTRLEHVVKNGSGLITKTCLESGVRNGSRSITQTSLESAAHSGIRRITKKRLENVVKNGTERLAQIVSNGCGSVGTNENEFENICVSSIQYLARQLKNETSEIGDLDFDFIIIDEAHHSLAESYMLLWRSYPDAYKLGVTATPYRLKGRGFTGLYGKLIESLKVSDFIKQGYLADYRFFTVSGRQAALQKVNRLTKVNAGGDYQTKDLQEIYAKSDEIEFLYDCYKEHAAGRKGIIYAVNLLHAEIIAGYFANRGVSIANIDSKTAKGKRRELIEKFRNGDLQILVNVELFGEGFDCPAIEFAMLARPTKSLAMYLQQVGRALRPMSNGSKVVILDCVGMYNRFGLPEEERKWKYFFERERKEMGEFAKPLGLDADFDGMVEIDTPRVAAAKKAVLVKAKAELEVYCTKGGYFGIRNGLGEIVEKPFYVELKKMKGDWFQGRDEAGNAVIFDKSGAVVFRKRNCYVVPGTDGRFFVGMASNDGTRFEIGPFDQRMCIEPKFIEPFVVKYRSGYCRYGSLTMYYQRDNYVAMSSFRLSLDSRFFLKTALMPRRGVVLLDFDKKPYTVSNDGSITAMQLSDDEVKKVLKASSAWGKKELALMGRAF